MIKKISGHDLNIVYYGTQYGGWGIEPSIICKNDIVYSFGVGTDISFDEQLINNHGVIVNAFDPTPRCVDWIKQQKLPNNFVFKQMGVSHFDGISYFNLPPKLEYVSYSETSEKNENCIELQVKTLKTIMKELNHDKVDILKMDIEGSEYGVLDHMLLHSIYPKIILVEFHLNKNEMEILNKFSEKYSIYNKINTRDYYLIKK
jgi:FkbM family methyltransferase